MAFWSKKETELEETYRTIEQQPGLNPTELAEQLGLASSTIQRRLPSLAEAGLLLYEDDRGGLWPFGKRNK
jgi:DNA-binding IclR family transcriptional regulator